MRKTKKMRAVEAVILMSLEDYLPEAVTKKGMAAVARELGVSKATLHYWVLTIGCTMHRICLRRGETIEIKQSGFVR